MSDPTMPQAADQRPDVIIIMTDEERAAPAYESDEITAWRRRALTGAAWFDDHAIKFQRHYTGSLACVPSRPTIFNGQYPDLHGVHPNQRPRQDGRRFADALAVTRRSTDAGPLVPRCRL